MSRALRIEVAVALRFIELLEDAVPANLRLVERLEELQTVAETGRA